MERIFHKIVDFIQNFPEFIADNAANPFLWIGIIVIVLLFFLIGFDRLGGGK